MKHDWVEQEVEAYNQRVYNGRMAPAAKKLLRAKLTREYDALEREQADVIWGYDDGEPLRDY